MENNIQTEISPNKNNLPKKEESTNEGEPNKVPEAVKFAEEKEVVFHTIPVVPSESSFDGDDEEEDQPIEETLKPKRKHRGGRRKIEIEYIPNKNRRHITFSKRKGGLMKKAYELTTLTGTEMIVLIASETGHVYTFATPKLQPIITNPEGKALIQTC